MRARRGELRAYHTELGSGVPVPVFASVRALDRDRKSTNQHAELAYMEWFARNAFDAGSWHAEVEFSSTADPKSSVLLSGQPLVDHEQVVKVAASGTNYEQEAVTPGAVPAPGALAKVRTTAQGRLGKPDPTRDTWEYSPHSFAFPEIVTELQVAPSPPRTLTICQLGDIHFGKYYEHGTEPVGKATPLGPPAKVAPFLDKHTVEVDYYVVCGDVGSTKSADFGDFAQLMAGLPGGTDKSRVLLVPGNHDSIWQRSKTDQLNAFRDYFVDEQRFRTPYGNGDDDNCVSVGSDTCPAAVWIYETDSVLFLLLTSCYYTGQVERDIAAKHGELLSDPESIDLKDRMRYEHGHIHTDHLPQLHSLLANAKEKLGHRYDGFLKIAVMHHDLEDLGGDTKGAVKGADIGQCLRDYGFAAVLHGHVHKARRSSSCGVEAISCPSFSGPHPDSLNGFNILEVTPPGQIKDIRKCEYEDNEFVERAV